MRAWKQLSNTITITYHVLQSLILLMMLGDIRWNTGAVHYIVRFRYQRMNVTILYLKD